MLSPDFKGTGIYPYKLQILRKRIYARISADVLDQDGFSV